MSMMKIWNWKQLLQLRPRSVQQDIDTRQQPQPHSFIILALTHYTSPTLCLQWYKLRPRSVQQDIDTRQQPQPHSFIILALTQYTSPTLCLQWYKLRTHYTSPTLCLQWYKLRPCSVQQDIDTRQQPQPHSFITLALTQYTSLVLAITNTMSAVV